jgi:RND family efflux transporter MFP subunit
MTFVRKRSRIIFLLIVVGLVGLVGYRVYSFIAKKQQTEPPEPPVVVVRAEPVELGTLRRDIRLTGDIEANTSVQVFPKCPGRLLPLNTEYLKKARALHEQGAISEVLGDEIKTVEEGDSVKKGQIIAVVDHESVEAQVNQAKAALVTAEAQRTQAQVALSQTEKDLERLRNLYAEGATSRQSLEKIEAEYKSLVAQHELAQARVDQSQAGLNQALIQLSECFITAPISGVIAQKFLEEGDMAMVTRPIFAIMDVDSVKVKADLAERYLRQVHSGTEAALEVDTYSDRSFQGRVTRISPVLNVINRTAQLEITIPNPEHLLKPGMFARIALTLVRKENVPIIPEAAVIRDESGLHVFVVEKGVARRRKVTLGLEEGPRVEVADGLRPGEMLVTAGQQRITQNQNVQIQQ